MRKRLLTGLLVVSLLLAVVLPGSVVLAANPEVAITVTALILSITNSQDTWTISTPVVLDTIVYFSADDTQDDTYSQIQNIGNCSVDIDIEGTDLVGTPTWALAGSVGEDQYTLFCATADGGSTYETEVKSSAYNTICTELTKTSTWDWSLKLTCPSSTGGSEDGSAKTATVTLVASVTP